MYLHTRGWRGCEMVVEPSPGVNGAASEGARVAGWLARGGVGKPTDPDLAEREPAAAGGCGCGSPMGSVSVPAAKGPVTGAETCGADGCVSAGRALGAAVAVW